MKKLDEKFQAEWLRMKILWNGKKSWFSKMPYDKNSSSAWFSLGYMAGIQSVDEIANEMKTFELKQKGENNETKNK